MKWFKNVEMLSQTLKSNEKRLEEVEYGSEIWNLLTDENNIIKYHLFLIKENKELNELVFKLKDDNDEICKSAYTLTNDLRKENDKLENVIKEAIKLLSIDGKGTKQQVAKMLKRCLYEHNN